MNKKCTQPEKRPDRFKSFFCIFITALLFMCATTVHAQSGSITLDLQGVKLKKVLNAIEEQTDYLFVYDMKVNVEQTVTAKANEMPLKAFLSSFLGELNISFTVNNHNISLSAREQAKDKPKSISGRVVSADNEPVIGATVSIKGANSGVITDLDGRFSINAMKGNLLVFSYLGYAPIEIAVTDNTALGDVKLEENKLVLGEVVVTALGIKREEKALSYNVQLIKQDDLTKVKDANFVNSLSGKVAGVTINKSATGVGGAARVVIRGAKSIEGDNNVLYVIDGIPLFNTNMGNTDSGIKGEGRAGSEGIADFNPEDIEGLTILSGPSAAALYGSSAANGAILITTKKGKEGKLQLTFSSSMEFSKPLMTPEFQTTYGNKVNMFESWGDKLASRSTYDPKNDFFHIGSNLINSLTLTTGNSQNQTFASIASTNAKGIVPNNNYDRLNLTIRNSSSFLNDKMRLDLGASYVKQKDLNMVSQGLYWNPITSAYLFPRGESFEAIKTFETYNLSRYIPVQYWPLKEGTYATQNPYWTAYRNLAPTEKDRYMFNIGLNYDILSWLSVSGRYRFDHSRVDFQRKIYASSDDKFAKKLGAFSYSNFMDVQEYADFMANINYRIKEFSLASHLGFSYSNYRALERGYGGNLLGFPNLFSINNINPSDSKVSEKGGNSRVRNLAAFISMELGWKSMLYLSLTGRQDWNSRLVNTSEESFFYPSVGLSGIVSEMVKLPSFISYLKVRGSYTEVGSPISVSGLTPGTVTIPIVGGIPKPTGIFPFDDFKAERTRSYELGVNLRLIKKINVGVTWYQSNTYNQTFLGELPESSGYEKVYLQAGDVENKGWEISVGFNDTFGDFEVSSSLAYTKNKNTIKAMVENFRHKLSPEPINIPQVMKEGGRVILKVGGSINDIYASSFLRKDNQGYVDIKEDGSFGLEQVTPVLLGKTTPDFTLGWNNSFSYKGFSLGFLLNGRFGGVVTSSTQAILDRFGVSKASGDSRDQGGVMIPNQGLIDAQKYYSKVATGTHQTAGYYTYSATNVRLQELSFGYVFPNNWFNNVLRDLTVSFIAHNPWMIYCKAPHDPELTSSTGTYGQGNDYFMQPSLKSLGFGVKAKF